MKPTIVISHESYVSQWMTNLLEQQFTVEFFDQEKTYTKSDLYYYTNRQSAETTKILETWLGKIVYDELYEANPFDSKCCIDDAGLLHLTARDFVWWEHSHSWTQKNYQNNFSKFSGDKFFLLLMNLQKPHRDRLYDLTRNKYHDHCLYSYISLGKRLEGDVPDRYNAGSKNDYCNMTWYDNTCFSLVAETKSRGKTFVSEKIYKPLAYGHPFVACGTKGMLKLLKLQGFETFSTVVDESYDDLDDVSRYKKIEQELERLFDLFKQNSLFNDKQIADILEHNHHHFFNVPHVDNLMKIQILEPILEYYHTS